MIPAGYLFNNPAGNIVNVTPTPDSLASLSTAQTDFFRRYPFHSHIYTLKHNYYSSYSSFQLSWNKSTGQTQFGANYTFSKVLATAASYNNMIPDPLNLRNE